jgi:hypothetical protein
LTSGVTVDFSGKTLTYVANSVSVANALHTPFSTNSTPSTNSVCEHWIFTPAGIF